MEVDKDKLDTKINVTDGIELQKIVKGIVDEERFVTYNVNKKVHTPDGGSYLGILYEIDIQGETVTERNKETNVFIKYMTPNAKITILSLSEAYINEIFVYKELSQIFTDLQNEAQVPEDERYKFVKSYEASNPNVIILENMSKRGFQTIFRMDVITLQYAQMAIEELAKFHALCFVLESKQPKYFERKIKTIKATFSFDEDWDGFVRNMCQIALNYLDENSKRKLEYFIPKFNAKYRKYLEGASGRLSLRHGDYRPNNILVKQIDGAIFQMIPIDYQLICYGCPILDLIYFIFSSMDQKFRKTHMLSLKNYYHEKLSEFLLHFDLDVNNVYSKKDFERDFDGMLDYGLMISILLIPLLMANENDVPNLTDQSLSDLHFESGDKCKERIVEVVEDFIEWEYL